MKVNLNVNITGLDGKEVKLDDKPFTVKDAVLNSLLVADPSEKDVSGKVKFERYQIASDISNNEGEVDLSVETISMIKTIVGNIYPALTVGRVYDVLEGNNGSNA